MGTDHYAICHDCKEYVWLGKWYGWDGFYEQQPPGCIATHTLKLDRYSWNVMRFMVFFANHQSHNLEMITEHQDPWDHGKEVMVPSNAPLMIPALKEQKLFSNPGDPIVDNITQLWIPDDDEGRESLAELRAHWENVTPEQRKLWEADE